MSQPLNRQCVIPALGDIDHEAGEFWVENPFMMLRGGQNLSAFERNCMFLNLAGDGFVDASFASQADIDSDSRSVVAADFDGDGAVDLMVGSVGGGPLRLFANRCAAKKKRVQLDLVGVKSNRSAVGSRVVIHCGGRTIVRDVFSANGFMGQGPTGLLVGLGDADQIDRLVVRWPTGDSQEFEKLPVDVRIRITEDQPQFEVERVW